MILKLKTDTDCSKSALLGQLGSKLICNLLFLQFVFIKTDYWQDQIQLVLIAWPVAAGGVFKQVSQVWYLLEVYRKTR